MQLRFPLLIMLKAWTNRLRITIFEQMFDLQQNVTNNKFPKFTKNKNSILQVIKIHIFTILNVVTLVYIIALF